MDSIKRYKLDRPKSGEYGACGRRLVDDDVSEALGGYWYRAEDVERLQSRLGEVEQQLEKARDARDEQCAIAEGLSEKLTLARQELAGAYERIRIYENAMNPQDIADAMAEATKENAGE